MSKKTVVIDGVEYEALTWVEALDDSNERVYAYYLRPLPKPRKSLADEANDFYDPQTMPSGYFLSPCDYAVCNAVERRLAELEKKIEGK